MFVTDCHFYPGIIFGQGVGISMWNSTLKVGYLPSPQILDKGRSERQWQTLQLITIWQQLWPQKKDLYQVASGANVIKLLFTVILL